MAFSKYGVEIAQFDEAPVVPFSEFVAMICHRLNVPPAFAEDHTRLRLVPDGA
jgi:hypothetical protein